MWHIMWNYCGQDKIKLLKVWIKILQIIFALQKGPPIS